MITVKLAFDRSARTLDADGRLHVARSGIYAITAPSGEQYVGSAVEFKSRWCRHLTQLRAGNHHNGPLQRAFLKYGEDRLTFSILIVCDKRHLLDYEQRAIDTLCPSYNICRVAGSHQGVKRSAETLARMSEAQRLRAPPSETTREKMRLSKTGTVRSLESRRKASDALKVFFSSPEAIEKRSEIAKRTNADPEVRAKISAALTGIKRNEETKKKMSNAQKGRISKLKGVPRSAEVKAKISATKRAKTAQGQK